MSWHYSRALVEAFSGASYLDGQRFVPWKSTPIAQDDYSSGKMKDTLHRSPFGMMYVPSTDDLGVELLTWFLEGFLVRTSPALAADLEFLEISPGYGLKCSESSPMFNRPGYSLKTLNTCVLEDLDEYSGTLTAWGMTRLGVSLELKIVKPRTAEIECGLLPTPTTKCNELSPSMSKWQAHRRLKEFMTQIGNTPQNNGGQLMSFREWMMGWPIGWTALEPLETGRFQQFLDWHGRH